MRIRRLAPISFVIFALTAGLAFAGCKEEAKKDVPSTPKAPEPIPSDYVVNGFFPTGTDEAPKVQVRGDSGAVDLAVDAAAGTPASAPADDGGGAVAARPGSAQMKVVEPGEEPRAVRRYDLKPGKAETVTVTLKATNSQDIPGQGSATMTQPPMVFALAMTPQPKTDDGEFPVKVNIARAEATAAPDTDPTQMKQLQQAMKMLVNQGLSFKLSPKGQAHDHQIANEQLARSEMGQLLLQPLEGLFVLLPDEPIGKNAKWEETATGKQEGITVNVTSTFVLKDITPDGLSISVTTKRKAAPQPFGDPRAPKGTTVAIDGTSTALVKVRLDRMPGKGTVDAQTTVTITQPMGPAGSKGAAMTQKLTQKQTIDGPT